jgi:hypothetical protein
LGASVGLWASPAFWKRRPAFALLLTALIGSAYGAIDEFHQYFVPGRSCDVWDWLADTLGALLGALAIMILVRMRAIWNIQPSLSQNSVSFVPNSWRKRFTAVFSIKSKVAVPRTEVLGQPPSNNLKTN